MTSAFGRLLLVDDEPAVLDVLCDYFVSQGHEVETATNGREALAAFSRSRPDLVLLDVRMPEMDGVEVLKELRARAATVPVIMVTANEDVALARLTLKLGAFDYVSKPFDFTYLDRAVTAGLLQAGLVSEPPPAAVDVAGDPWRALALAVFRAAREMTPLARASTGERMESAALVAAREAAAGAGAPARRQLEDLALLLALSAELGDLGSVERAVVETALATARRALPDGG